MCWEVGSGAPNSARAVPSTLPTPLRPCPVPSSFTDLRGFWTGSSSFSSPAEHWEQQTRTPADRQETGDEASVDAQGLGFFFRIRVLLTQRFPSPPSPPPQHPSRHFFSLLGRQTRMFSKLILDLCVLLPQRKLAPQPLRSTFYSTHGVAEGVYFHCLTAGAPRQLIISGSKMDGG